MLGNALLGSSPRPGLAFLINFMVETDMHEYTHSPWCECWKSPGELLNVGVPFTEEKRQGSQEQGFYSSPNSRMRNLDGEAGLHPQEIGL